MTHLTISADPSVATEPFCRLADPRRYVACNWDLSVDDEGRQHWVGFFKRHLETIMGMGVAASVARGEARQDAQARAADCRAAFGQHFDGYAADPTGFGRVTILTLDQWRDQFLRQFGFFDPFVDLKKRENEKMLPLLPRVCGELDALAKNPAAQLHAIISGVFAGNIFDMGAEATAKAFLGNSPDFHSTRDSITPHPWLVDDYAALAGSLLKGRRHRKAVFFIDNAGSDFLLGALPMMRWLAQRGTQVVLAANARPTLNDMTIDDVRAWWPRIVSVQPDLADLPITAANTGTGEPLIDLAAVSPELNTAAAGADLVILEGMGRGIESNLDADFACDSLNLGMIKDIIIAKRLEGKMFDVVCRYR